jgi:hypothetical protein
MILITLSHRGLSTHARASTEDGKEYWASEASGTLALNALILVLAKDYAGEAWCVLDTNLRGVVRKPFKPRRKRAVQPRFA